MITISPGHDVKLQLQCVPWRGRVDMREVLIWNVTDERFVKKTYSLDEVCLGLVQHWCDTISGGQHGV